MRNAGARGEREQQERSVVRQGTISPPWGDVVVGFDDLKEGDGDGGHSGEELGPLETSPA
jgi:hypothetical protein